MNKYQELVQQVKEMKAQMFNEFTSKAKVGDFVKFRDIVGILFPKKGGQFKFVPIQMPMYWQNSEVYLSADLIPEVTLIDEAEFCKYFKTIALRQDELDKGIPF